MLEPLLRRCSATAGVSSGIDTRATRANECSAIPDSHRPDASICRWFETGNCHRHHSAIGSERTKRHNPTMRPDIVEVLGYFCKVTAQGHVRDQFCKRLHVDLGRV
jgi:hypothetical protein